MAKISDITKDIGETIRRLRTEQSVSIEELAERCGVHYNYLGEIERGRRNPSIKSLAKIAAGLNVKLGVFFDNTRAPASKRGDISRADLLKSLKLLSEFTQKDRSDAGKFLSLALKILRRKVKQAR
jgi:transcriptional regulator with XRE-family HTH domain